MFALSGKFRAFQSDNFRFFFLGQFVSLSGSWMQSMVESWLVFRMTQSGIWLGSVAFTYGLFSFLAAPLAGILADRYNRKKLLIYTELVCMIQAFILTVLVATHTIQPWHIVVLAAVLGLATGFELTVRVSLLSDIVDESILPSAIFVNATANYTARIIGPAMGGLILQFADESVCFGVNGLTFLFVLICLFKIREKPHTYFTKKNTFFKDFKEGVDYLRGNKLLWRSFSVASVSCLVGYTYPVLFPMISKNILNGGSKEYSAMITFFGLGGTLGALLQKTNMDSEKTVNSILLLKLISMGILLPLVSLSRNFMFSSALCFIFGWVFLSLNPIVLSMIQASSDKQIRSRINSLYFMLILGAAPVGGFLAGILASKWGPQTAAFVLGGLCIFWAFALKLRWSI